MLLSTTLLLSDIMGAHSSQDLLSELEKRGPVGRVSLAEELGSHPTTIDRLCYDLQADGYVCQTSSGVYDITKNGETYLQELSGP